jgi:hypothetical protein
MYKFVNNIIISEQKYTMAVEYIKERVWAILPTKNEQCFDNKCLNIINPRGIAIYSELVNNIDLGFKLKLPKGHIFQVKNHLSDKPWKVTCEFLFPRSEEETLTIPIITSENLCLDFGEVLAHVQLCKIAFALSSIPGKCNRLKLINLFIYLLLYINLIYITPKITFRCRRNLLL